jgi:hypothetical protein
MVQSTNQHYLPETNSVFKQMGRIHSWHKRSAKICVTIRVICGKRMQFPADGVDWFTAPSESCFKINAIGEHKIKYPADTAD